MKFYSLFLLIIGILAWWTGIACSHGHTNPIAIAGTKADSLQPSSPLLRDTFQTYLTLDYVMGKFDPATHPDFTPVDSQYGDKAGMYLRKDAYQAFLQMYREALKDSIHLRIVSATRNFEAQKVIWEGKWTGARLVDSGENLAQTTPDPKQRAMKILRYSSMPGSSRHHWGTDVDLNNLESSWFDHGEGLRTYQWMKENGGRFGFCQPYTAGRPYGYNEEKWHWSY
ncbi:MAG TPA: M15 family metallopeptidase, partial [Saprospiraceae bacterium]|nr:M15 family metallopeptidase [Saprospiraceae bacterium]